MSEWERFNEEAAKREVEQLPDRFLASFLAMKPALRDRCIARFNAFFQAAPKYHEKFHIAAVEAELKQKQDIEGTR